MALKLNENRTYKYQVQVAYYDEDGKVLNGSFTGVFKVLKTEDMQKKDVRLIDTILVGVEGIDLQDVHGNSLEGEELLNAVRNDSDFAEACIAAYNDSVEKKRVKKRTSET